MEAPGSSSRILPAARDEARTIHTNRFLDVWLWLYCSGTLSSVIAMRNAHSWMLYPAINRSSRMRSHPPVERFSIELAASFAMFTRCSRPLTSMCSAGMPHAWNGLLMARDFSRAGRSPKMLRRRTRPAYVHLFCSSSPYSRIGSAPHCHRYDDHAIPLVKCALFLLEIAEPRDERARPSALRTLSVARFGNEETTETP